MLSIVTAALAFLAPPRVQPDTRLAAAAAAAALSVCVAAPAFAGDAAKGECIFSGNCAACHIGGRNIIMPDKTLQQQALEAYLEGGANVSLQGLVHTPFYTPTRAAVAC